MPKNRDIVLFLGAGFSDAAGLPVMSHFAERAALSKSRIPEYAHNGTRKLAVELYSAARTYEKFQDWAFSNGHLNKLETENIECLFCLAKDLAATGDLQLNVDGDIRDREKVIAALVRWVWKTYQRLPFWDSDTPSDPQPYAKFWDQVRRAGLEDRLAVITTNYDLVFEDRAKIVDIGTCYPILHQVEINVGTGTRRFVGPAADVDCIPVLKLHGSVNYFAQPGAASVLVAVNHSDGMPIGDSKIRKEMPASAALDALWDVRMRQQEPAIEPVIVPPMAAKRVETAWQREIQGLMDELLRKASHILFIGYSLLEKDKELVESIVKGVKCGVQSEVHVMDLSQNVGERYRAVFSGQVGEIGVGHFKETVNTCLPRIFSRICRGAS